MPLGFVSGFWLAELIFSSLNSASPWLSIGNIFTAWKVRRQPPNAREGSGNTLFCSMEKKGRFSESPCIVAVGG
jgi:hypothetical protein